MPHAIRETDGMVTLLNSEFGDGTIWAKEKVGTVGAGHLMFFKDEDVETDGIAVGRLVRCEVHLDPGFAMPRAKKIRVYQ
jgi:hypothetical protein